MSQVLSSQQITRTSSESNHQKRIVTVTLWTVQVLLALTFLSSGTMKLILPLSMLTAQVPLPGLFVRFLGIAEISGALGLILPGLLRIQRGLTPLAACGLIIIMIGAVIITLAIGGGASALVPLVVGLLATTVAYGRRSWSARS
jgi:uncharacterized membrane protein YphA (DoxX/SURF4 family)